MGLAFLLVIKMLLQLVLALNNDIEGLLARAFAHCCNLYLTFGIQGFVTLDDKHAKHCARIMSHIDIITY